MSRGPIDQNLLGYCGFRLAGAVLPCIPAGLAYRLAALMGDAYYRFLPGRWPGVASNISHVLRKPVRSPEVRRVVRQVCRNLALNFYDLFRVPRLCRERILDLVETVGWEHIEAARATGRGVVITAPHFGNLDIVMQGAAIRALPITIPAEHLRPERLYQYVSSLRTSHGMLRLVPADGPLLQLYRALRRNEAVAIAADRNVSDSGRMVEFFGVPAQLPDSHIRLALRTGAAMIVAFGHRRPGGRFLLQLRSVTLEEIGDLDERVEKGMRILVSLLEEGIRADPGQWVLTVPLWDHAWSERRS